MGLSLSRRKKETIIVDEQIIITVTDIDGGRVSMNIEAPRGMFIRRGEIPPRPQIVQPPVPLEEKS